MGLPSFVVRWLGTDRVDDLAERVAGRSRMAVWQRASGRLPALAPIEARGYLRARAIPVVQAETARLIEQEGGTVARLREPIVEAALSLLIEAITTQAGQRRATSHRRQAA